MAQLLGVAGFAGSGCSPRCKRTHTPQPKRDKQAQRSYEKSQWLKEVSDVLSR